MGVSADGLGSVEELILSCSGVISQADVVRLGSTVEGLAMVRDRLSDEAWEPIADVFPPPAAVGRKRKDHRDVVDGILYVLLTGCPWRDLHEEFSPWQSVTTTSTTGQRQHARRGVVGAGSSAR